MSGETDEKATKVFPKFWRPGSQAVSASPVRTARTTRAQDTIAALGLPSLGWPFFLHRRCSKFASMHRAEQNRVT